MTTTAVCRCLTLAFTLAGVAGAAPVSAQYLDLSPTVVGKVPATEQAKPLERTARPSLFKPFTDSLGDFKRLPTRANAEFLVVGLAAAASVHAADSHVTAHFANTNSSFRPGSIIGGTAFEFGMSFATYAIGRSTNNARIMSVGSDLIRAQVMAEVLTVGIKQGTRRSRPEGSGFSFPSGHTTAAFATATVLQQHFGWRIGAPAYALATYVGASRVEMKRHYLSDVAFGAALGIVAGRTVTIGHRHQFAITPVTAGDGASLGAGLTWVGHK